MLNMIILTRWFLKIVMFQLTDIFISLYSIVLRFTLLLLYFQLVLLKQTGTYIKLKNSRHPLIRPIHQTSIVTIYVYLVGFLC